MKKEMSKNMSKTELKKLIKTELAIVQVTTDNKKFLNEYKAIIHESELEDIRKQDRRWNKMKQNITDIVLEVLKDNRWGIYSISEPMQVLPVKDSTSTLFKVNDVNMDEFQQAIKTQIDRESERNNGCQENQARDLPIDNESLDGTKMTLNDTNE
tara:strand:- start:373 stop:837 length:465 start_codon:yes stop_codon:yes gene_type:complete